MSVVGVKTAQPRLASWHDDSVADLERIAYYRALDERAALRRYFRHEDEEGGRWYSKAAPDRGELIVLKQAELTSAGQFHRYSWEHLEDERGGLTDQAIDPELDPLEAIPVEEYQRAWNR